MESENVGELLENKVKLIKVVCHKAMKAHKFPKEPFRVSTTESEVIFSFPGSWAVKDWISNGPFGKTEINKVLFPSLRSIGNDEAAIVNEAFQSKFESIMNQNKLQTKIINAEKDKKQIVFTGHSSGGPIAVLATIWHLEQKAKQKGQTQSPFEPLCVTFGSPLLGNRIISHSLRRENWSRHFVHFVTRHDIVPRLLIAPLTPISEPHLAQLFAHLAPKSKGGSIRPRVPDFEPLFMDVIGNALTLTSQAAIQMTGSKSLLAESLTSFTELSPYRPFGSYVFLGESDELVSFNNSEAILQFLFFSFQPSSEEEAREFAGKSVEDHSVYESKLEKIIGWKICGGTGSDEDKIFDVLNNVKDEFGLCESGRLRIFAAGESEKQKMRNLRKIESENKKEIERLMGEIENYRRTCNDRNVGYFDSFKLQKNHDDFIANVTRLKIVGNWDEITQMLKSNNLPDVFEGLKDWIDIGTKFRRLVEPLDIANYYRHWKDGDSGPYMGSPGKGIPRPKNYRFTQKWLEHEKKLEVDSCFESNFWAELEQLSHGNSEISDERASKLQKSLVLWKAKGVIENDVFLSATFVGWWGSLKNKEDGIEKLVNETNVRTT